MNRKILVYPSPDEAALALAEFLVKEMNDTINRKRSCKIALSGGNTPGTLFRAIASHYPDSVKWEFIDFFWADERCVPPDNSESNYLMAMESLLGKIDIPSSNIHRIEGENDPARESLRYSAEIIAYTELNCGVPSFDIVLLGMGEDGHTASIFPGLENLFTTDEICVSTVHPVTGQKRITITGKIINNAANVVIFITGKGKASLLGEILGDRNPDRDYPVLHVAPSRGRLFWYLDKEAASELK